MKDEAILACVRELPGWKDEAVPARVGELHGEAVFDSGTSLGPIVAASWTMFSVLTP